MRVVECLARLAILLGTDAIVGFLLVPPSTIQKRVFSRKNVDAERRVAFLPARDRRWTFLVMRYT